VSVVIAARNEAANIGACIESVSWAREILVVEDASTDDTERIARAAGATVLSKAFVTIGLQRNAAISRASCAWILAVDADERGSPELGEEIARVIAAAECEGYRVPRRNIFLGREVRHGGWERDRPVRLFRSRYRYDSRRVHEHVEVTGRIGELSSSLTHEPYASLDSWLEKVGRYSGWWAEDCFEQGKRSGVLSVVFRPPVRFVTMYLARRGFMDGSRGAILAGMAAVSVFAKYARLWAKALRPG
jgi:glycosyltransferase involved in cell wall biosynthesis